MKNEIILYQSNELPSRIEVRVEDETVWLNRHQIATLFGRDVKTIGKHINNVFTEGELAKEVVVANFATTTEHGAIKGKTQTYNVEHYNLDVIISVGYRVKSKQGTQFRIWANKVLKDYLLKGYSLNNRMNRIEDNIQVLSERVDEIDLQINTILPPRQGIFFNGQIFDAYNFVSDLIRKAERSLILIDNYIDDSVITHFTKRKDDVELYIYTKHISKQLKLDIEKHNLQYPPVKISKFDKAHDRFLIIDKKEIYHFGASLKDLGKKWFAFSKLHFDTSIILKEI
ncbi:MAG: virulence RhuM family protein [Candidatus Marinimicrobia bacterium]|nr:virulence RhuM family protein [Candidatus Neomarinimicrobiota bacterium]